MTRHSLAVQHSSAKTGGKDDWQTPDSVLDLVRSVNKITLDPCTSEKNPTRATAFYHYPLFDGLEQYWDVATFYGGLAYVNPPYSQVKKWTDKCSTESKTRGVEIVYLVAARPDTRWFKVIWDTSQAVCFWRGRLKFKGATSAAPFPSALAYWGENVENFERAFKDVGKVVVL